MNYGYQPVCVTVELVYSLCSWALVTDISLPQFVVTGYFSLGFLFNVYSYTRLKYSLSLEWWLCWSVAAWLGFYQMKGYGTASTLSIDAMEITNSTGFYCSNVLIHTCIHIMTLRRVHNMLQYAGNSSQAYSSPLQCVESADARIEFISILHLDTVVT